MVMEFVRVTAFGSDQHNHGSRGDFSKNLFFSNLISQMVPKNSETMDKNSAVTNKNSAVINMNSKVINKNSTVTH